MSLLSKRDFVIFSFTPIYNLRLSNSGYLSIWLYFVFVTSVVVTNSVKGTTVAFLMAYGALVIPLLTRSSVSDTFYLLLIKLLAVYVGLAVVSQLSILLASNLPSSVNLILISSEQSFFLRSSLFTQSLYVIPSFALFCFVVVYYSPQHEKHLTISLLIFVLVGYYKVIFYQLFKQNGDFLSNRVFGDGLENPGQFQIITLGGLEINRFVSLTGEPSMYVFAIFPYFVYFLYRGKKLIASFLLSSLVLTFSGTFAIALFLLVLFHFLLVERNLNHAGIIVVSLVLVWLLVPSDVSNMILKEILFDKLNQESTSGIERTENFINQLAFFSDLPVLNKLVGVGFGTVRSTDLFSTLLVNTGVIGQILFTLLFAVPVHKLPRRENGLRLALLITYSMLQISVSEYSYSSLWLLLGLAYHKLFTNERLRQRTLS